MNVMQNIFFLDNSYVFYIHKKLYRLHSKPYSHIDLHENSTKQKLWNFTEQPTQ